jgi:hypothetical protein
MAVESAHVTAAIVSAGEYPDLISRYRISGVPMTVVNEAIEILGARSEEQFVTLALGQPPDA